MSGADQDGTFFDAADAEHVRREKARARDLRRSGWWTNQLGRGQCYYCGSRVHPRELTMDHVVPIVRGGRSTRHNVVPCCKACNSRKKYLVPSEWQGYLEQLRRGRPAAAPATASPTDTGDRSLGDG